ncbi:MAG: FecR domain-containing protein [Anaerolineae bacterium]|nr:FecR domain-containing protein [Anaerolineae bacterium]
MLVILLLVSSPAAVFAGAVPPSRAGPAQAERIASLDPVQGLVQVQLAGNADQTWRSVAQRELVGEGDWVRTGPKGLAVLTFFEGIQSEILPNTLVRVGPLSAVPDTPPVVGLDVLFGDVLSQVEKIADAPPRFEIHTPNATLTVRGTQFWTNVGGGETHINALDGIVLALGVKDDGLPWSSVMLMAGLAVTVLPDSRIGPVSDIQDLPQLPARAALAPPTCGNRVCDPGEKTTCPVDCRAFERCGNGMCEPVAGEGPVTCPADCVQNVSLADTAQPEARCVAGQAVYAAPDLAAQVIGEIQPDETMFVIGSTPGYCNWVKILTERGLAGWVPRMSLAIQEWLPQAQIDYLVGGERLDIDACVRHHGGVLTAPANWSGTIWIGQSFESEIYAEAAVLSMSLGLTRNNQSLPVVESGVRPGAGGAMVNVGILYAVSPLAPGVHTFTGEKYMPGGLRLGYDTFVAESHTVTYTCTVLVE